MNLRTHPFERRRFLKASALSFTALGLSSLGIPSISPFLRQALAGVMKPGKKLLFIFLRGGLDSVDAVIPYGDPGIPGTAPTYLQARPRLGIQPADAHNLNDFVSLHPSFQGELDNDPKLLDIYNATLDPSRPTPNLAVLHRIGYAEQNRSHFSSQQFWENGVPGAVKLEEGVFARYIAAYLDESKPMQAATVSGNQMVIMKGGVLIPVLRSVNDFSLPSNVLLGTLPDAGNPLGSGLKGAYGQTGFNASIQYEPLTYDTGTALLESLQYFRDNVLSVPYTPRPEAQPFYAAINDARFRQSVQDCARLLKQVESIQVVGCNQDGYDTHGSQNVRLPPLIRNLGLAFTALYFDLADIWEDTVVITMSEFGRTPAENGNLGTDHGQASVCFAMGGPVAGGVYNADAAHWPPGTLFAASGRYLLEATDFRNMYHEVLTRHLGDPDGQIDTIIPGYSGLVASDTRGLFTPMGFIRG